MVVGLGAPVALALVVVGALLAYHIHEANKPPR